MFISSRLFCVVISGVILCSCREPDHLSNERLKIAVVGDGVPTSRPTDASKRTYPLNNAQGAAMWKGAYAAFESSPRLASIKSKLLLVGFDDMGNAREAAAIAEEIRSDRAVLAVIGHATSGTTRAAADTYADGAIPLLMPIATSPYVAFRAGKRGPQNRLPYCFRLPPSDVPSQATAVAIVALEKLSSKRIYLIRDISPDAGEYSGPLFSSLRTSLASKIVSTQEVDINTTQFRDVAIRVEAERADLVVFCGYGSTAQKLLGAIRNLYAPLPPADRPRVVATDGSNIATLNTDDLQTYLTFPISAPALPDCNPSDYSILRGILPQGRLQSYEVYGYDAILLVGQAYSDCEKVKGKISRVCIAQQLQTPAKPLAGACLPYSFREGENLLSEYYVYSNTDSVGQVKGPLQLKWELSAEELARFTTLGTHIP